MGYSPDELGEGEGLMPTDGAVITVEAKIMGQRKPVVAGWPVTLAAPPAAGRGVGEETMRLRDLLSQVVRQETLAFRQRQEERRLVRVLSPAQIQQAAERGKVDMGGRSAAEAGAEVDDEAAVATALQSFEDGLYFVFLDGQQQHDLDAVVWPHPNSHLTFIRLVALAGG